MVPYEIILNLQLEGKVSSLTARLNLMYKTEGVSMKDIEWASLLYTLVTDFDEVYAKTMIDIDERFRPFNVKELNSVKSIGETIIYFLHSWHTQGVPNFSKNELTNKIKELADELELVNKSTMHSVTSEKIKLLYDGIVSVTGFGPTATAKTLHLLCPNVCVMWDKGIREWYEEKMKFQGIKFHTHAEQYASFLRDMSQFVKTKFNSRAIDELNTILKSLTSDRPFYPKTEAKLVDEFNWLTMIKKVKIPFKYTLKESLLMKELRINF